MFAAAFIILSLITGALLLRRLTPVVTGSPLSSLGEVLLFSLIAPSFVGIVLVEVGAFSPPPITVGLAIGAVIAALVWARRKPAPPAAPRHPSSKRWALLLGAILIGGALLRFPPLNFVRGGQDPGVYVNIANLLARTGRLDFADPLAPILADKSTELGRIYFKNSYRAVACKTPDNCRGAFLPGFYLKGIDPSRIIPQFYHLHPIWMGYSHLIGGGEHTAAILFIFGVLSLYVFFLIGCEICTRRSSALVGTALLAASPGYAYFARFPVSEVTASLFLLATVLFLIRSRLRTLPEMIAAALFGALYFFTHITGFMVLALLYPAFVLAAVRAETSRERRAPIIGWSLFVIFFAWSYAHGLAHSRPYAVSIWSKIGAPDHLIGAAADHPVLFGAVLLAASLLPFLLAIRWREKIVRVCSAPRSKTVLLLSAAVFVVIFLLFLIYKAWLLGFTDHYAESRWIGKRWHLAGRGWWSIRHMTALVLTYFVSPIGVLLALYGWLRMSRRIAHTPHMTAVFVCVGGLALALVGRQLTAPYLYYFGRYLVAGLVPLTILFAVYGLERIHVGGRTARRRSRGILVAAMLAVLLPFSWRQSRADESAGLYTELSRLAAAVGERAVIFIDEVNFARVELGTPLEISFGIPTITYSRRDYTGEPLRALMRSAHELGFTVYLLSEKDRGATLPFLTRVDGFVFPLASLVPADGAVMPTVYRRGRQSATLHRFEPDSSSSPQLPPAPR